ncbi:MAG: GTPase Era [Anaerolineaceae bacterium]|nr:GTPase Era [Anaerolineaceae bacterium]
MKADYGTEGLYALRLLPETSLEQGKRAETPDEEGKRIMDALNAYFLGHHDALDALKLDLTRCTPFEQLILNELRKVSWGQTLSYGQLAVRAGKPGAARAVGTALAHNPILLAVPCHRVLGSDGRLHGFSAEGGLETKAWLLRHEGHTLKNGRLLTASKPQAPELPHVDYGGFRSGYVAIIGKPNSGKSSLLNRLMGQEIAGVSKKPQTTRRRQLGILTDKESQIIFLDTPGFHDPVDKLSIFINAEASGALADADMVLFLADSTAAPDETDSRLAALLSKKQPGNILLLMTKSDAADRQKSENNRKRFMELLPGVQTLSVSSLTGQGMDALLQTLRSQLPEGPLYYPEDHITEDFERDIAAEMIRAAAMEKFSDEIPYSIAVRIAEYKERENTDVYIVATIFVEREAQKGIVIGKGGQMIKEIGISARQAIEKMSGRKVFLSLDVKVQKEWKDNPQFLREMGLFKQNK